MLTVGPRPTSGLPALAPPSDVTDEPALNPPIDLDTLRAALRFCDGVRTRYAVQDAAQFGIRA